MSLTLLEGKQVAKADLDLVPLPRETSTYIPISHYQLTDLILTVSQDVLKDYVLVGENYGLARKGNQLFACLNFKGESSEMALSIAYRNSYDKSMTFGMAFGAQVYICENLALTGDIVVMKKHTKTVWETLEDTVIANIFKAQKHYQKVIVDSQRMKSIAMDNRSAFQMMGLLFGHEIVGPRQLTVLRDHWLRPTHSDFQARNSWSFLNATTEALKSCPPNLAIEKHIRAYNQVLDFQPV